MTAMDPERLHDPDRFERLQRELDRIVGGLEVLDRSLELDDGQKAELVATDAEGRLVLVLGSTGEGSEPVLACLDALAFARANGALLARHVRADGVRAGADARVFLVAEKLERRVVDRLAPLLGGPVELFELRTLRSAGGARTYLARVQAPATESSAAVGAAAFLDSVPEAARALARVCLERMRRVDPALVEMADARRVLWSADGRELARLELEGMLLVGASPAGLRVELTDALGVDVLVEEALAGFAELLRGSVDDGRDSRSEDEDASLDPGAPLLTPEEMEAFRT